MQATHFYQPAGGIALNRISATQGASQIYGILTATGKIILINPAGIYFGPNSSVNVGGLIATTSDISNENFLKGNYHFDITSPYANASITNAGRIIARNNGLVALVGPNVTNNGLIQANLGRVVLASGDAFTVDFANNGLINFALDKPAVPRTGHVTNTGSLIANGGKILVTAQAASNVLDNVINMQGIAQAKSVYKQNGEIIISGDPNGGVVKVASNINASGKGKGQTGGTVNITGYDILIDSPALIDVSGDAGGGAINIGGNLHGLGPLPNAKSVVMAPGSSLFANAITSGNGGQIVVWSNDYTHVMGNIFAMGGSLSGNGGFVETSSHNRLDAIGATVNTSAVNGKTGTWLLDPANVTISAGADTNYSNVGNVFEPNGGAATATVNTGTLDAALSSNNIEITTTNNGADGGNAGTITVANAIGAGGTWVGGNSLTLTAASTIAINAPITIGTTSGAQLILNTPSTISQTAVIDGPGGLTMEGGGTFTASQANAYTGGTTIKNGTILLTNASGIGTSGPISITPNSGSSTAVLDTGSLTSFNNVSTISMNSSILGSTAKLQEESVVNLTLPNAITLTGPNNVIAPNSDSIVSSGGITGTGGLTVNGTAIFFNLYLDAANNTYSGTTTITAGDLIGNTTNALSPNSAVVLGNNPNSRLELNNFNNTIASLAGGGASGGLVSLDGPAILTIANANPGSTSYAGVITGNKVIIDLTGTGSPSQAFTGGTNTLNNVTVNAGKLVVGNAGALGPAATITLAPSASNTAKLDLTGVSSLTATGTISLDSSAAGSIAELDTSNPITLNNVIALTGNNNNFNVAANSFTQNGAIDGTAPGNASLTIQGPGTFILGANIGSGNALANFTTNSTFNLGNNAAISANNININNGVGGGFNLALNGTSMNLLGSLAINNLTVTGTGVDNTISLQNANPQTWNITGTDVGNIATSGIAGTGSFNNIQNITGGNAGNQFIFADNASLTGLLNGGGLSTLSYLPYTTPVHVTLTDDNDKFVGNARNNSNALITSYSNINNLVGNPGLNNILTPTNAQLSRVQITGPMSGRIEDPLTWSGFNVILPPTAVPPTTTTVTGADVSPIIQQPQNDTTNNNNTDISATMTMVNQNMNDFQAQANALFDTNLSTVKINPRCL